MSDGPDIDGALAALDPALLARFEILINPDGTVTFVDFPPEFSGGIGSDGVKNLKEFVEQGGTLVAMASACDFVIDEFNVPVVNVLARAKSDEFNCPGSLLRLNIDPKHPVTYGMPAEVPGFVNQRIAFQTTPRAPEMTRWVLALYRTGVPSERAGGWVGGFLATVMRDALGASGSTVVLGAVGLLVWLMVTATPVATVAGAVKGRTSGVFGAAGVRVAEFFSALLRTGLGSAAAPA